MKWLRRTVLGLVVLLLFVLSTMIAIVILVNPNDYKDQIEQTISEVSGRDLHINGAINLSVFPWLGLELNDVSLDNLPGFSEPHFAEVEKLNIKVALLPLLVLKVEVGQIQLAGMQINLQRRKDGTANWDDFLAAKDPAIPESTAEQETINDTGASGVAVRDFYVGGIKIEDAGIIWNDETADVLTRVEFMNLTTDAIRLGKNTEFDLNFALRNENPKIIAGVELSGSAGFMPATKQLRINALAVDTRVSGPVIPGNDQNIQFTLRNLVADLNTPSISISQVILQAAGLNLTLQLDAKDILTDNLVATGKLELRADSIRNLFRLLSQPVPITSDNTVFQSLQLSSEFSAGLESVSANKIALIVDDSQLTGEVAIENFQSPVYRFALHLDAINLDRYLAPVADEDTVIGNPVLDEAGNTNQEQLDEILPIPVDLLRELNAEGEISIDKLQVVNLKPTALQFGVKAENGITELKPVRLDLYGGQVSADTTVDVSGTAPAYSGSLDVASVQSGPLLTDYLGKPYVDGQIKLQGHFATQGERLSVLKRNLNGRLDLVFKDAALSMNIRQQLRSIKRKLSGQVVPAADPVGEPTKFSSITATAEIERGVVKNDDLEVRARHLYASGKGLFRLPDNYIDYVLTLILSDDGAGQDDLLDNLVDFPIELVVRGKLEELDYVDIAQSALTGAAKAKLKQGLKAKEEELKAEAERKVQEAVKEKEAEIERKKKEAEERARQKLEEKKNKLLDRLFN